MLDFMRFLIVAVSLCVGAAGCGQKGSLYVRDNPPPGVKPPKTDAYQPVPYPKEPKEQPQAGREATEAK
jgi:predicted small lipoprotein YifL